MSALELYTGNSNNFSYFSEEIGKKHSNNKSKVSKPFNTLNSDKKKAKDYSPYMSLWNIRVLETFYDTRLVNRRASLISKKVYENRKMSTQNNMRLSHAQMLQGSVQRSSVSKGKEKTLLKTRSAIRLDSNCSGYF
eukprot:TRINITY_DN16407_c0_g1_i1.p1 TRINITY_DN16407_c0_g1~~TRINITY_DN16407_c0_g1_i1.p1  ORF type:complete len:136 (+),score=23.38 TRINITY_DN16407_c0_g1_i1:432-839(+)